MKAKTIFYFLTFTLIFLISCEDKKDDKKNNDPLIGTWEAVSMSVTLADGTFFSVPVGAGMSMTLEIKEDGTFTMTQVEDGETEVSSGTWSADDDTITITESSGTEMMNYEVSGDTLTLSITEYDDDLGGAVTITIEFRKV
jgi:hypothetical protein